MKVLTDNALFTSMALWAVLTFIFSLAAMVRVRWFRFEQPLSQHDARRILWVGMWMFRLSATFGVIAALAAIWTVFIKNATDGNAPVVMAIISCLMAMLLVAGAHVARFAFESIFEDWQVKHAIHGALLLQQ